MLNIHFIDPDLHYVSTLSSILSVIFPDAVFTMNSVDLITDGPGAIIFSSDPGVRNIFPSAKHVLIFDNKDYIAKDEINTVYKYSDPTKFIKYVECLTDRSGRSDFSSVDIPVCIFTGNAAPPYFTNEVLKEAGIQLHKGRIPVIAEICPRYCNILPYDSNNLKVDTLSDVFARIMNDEMPAEDMGIYIEPSVENTYRFRPFTNSDDIYECSAAMIRRFILIFSEWNSRGSGNHYAILCMINMPFSHVFTAATICGKLNILNSEELFRNNEYNKEISSLLLNLPGTCLVRQYTERYEEEKYGVSDDRTK